MLLAFVRPLVTGWALRRAESGNTLCMPQFLQWGHQLSFIWCWLSGGICESISGQPRGIPGIICSAWAISYFELLLLKSLHK